MSSVWLTTSGPYLTRFLQNTGPERNNIGSVSLLLRRGQIIQTPRELYLHDICLKSSDNRIWISSYSFHCLFDFPRFPSWNAGEAVCIPEGETCEIDTAVLSGQTLRMCLLFHSNDKQLQEIPYLGVGDLDILLQLWDNATSCDSLTSQKSNHIKS